MSLSHKAKAKSKACRVCLKDVPTAMVYMCRAGVSLRTCKECHVVESTLYGRLLSRSEFKNVVSALLRRETTGNTL
eukprot:1188041-Prorocentrum_minimum.AAC.9